MEGATILDSNNYYDCHPWWFDRIIISEDYQRIKMPSKPNYIPGIFI
jgi:hypothetical protein